jgi:pimeloyl-ACP methyl ester carboxylesterase
MDAAGIARAHVFGMSLGGMIAQQVAIAHSDRVDRLVLGCTTPGGKRAKQTSLAGRLALLRASLGSVDRQLALLVSDEAARTRPEIRAQWLANAAAEPVKLRGVIGQTMAALRHDAFARLGSISNPTLVITGDDDVIIPPENSQLIAAQIPHAKLVVLAGARHDFATDRPGDTARAIVEHLGA